MKIRARQGPTTVPLKDVIDGECFSFPDDLRDVLIRVKNTNGFQDAMVDAVKLNGQNAGGRVTASADHPVILVDCELVMLNGY